MQKKFVCYSNGSCKTSFFRVKFPKFLIMDSDSDTDLEELSRKISKSLEEFPYSWSSDEDMEVEQNQDERRTEENQEEPQPGPSNVQNPPQRRTQQNQEEQQRRNPPQSLQDQGNVNEISNISINEQIGSVQSDDFTVTYSRIPFRSNNTFDFSDYHFDLRYSFRENNENLLISSALQGILNALGKILEELKEKFPDQDRILYITLLHDDLISSVNVGPLNFANDSIEYMVEKMHTKLANILNSEKSLKADKHLTVLVKVLGKALKYNPF